MIIGNYHDKPFMFFLDVFLSPEPEHSKCYCGSCCQLRAEPDVKYSGDPPAKYAVPHGWVKFGLKYVHAYTIPVHVATMQGCTVLYCVYIHVCVCVPAFVGMGGCIVVNYVY